MTELSFPIEYSITGFSVGAAIRKLSRARKAYAKKYARLFEYYQGAIDKDAWAKKQLHQHPLTHGLIGLRSVFLDYVHTRTRLLVAELFIRAAVILLAGASLLVQPLHVTPLALLDGSRDVHLDERARLLHESARLATRRLVGGDSRDDDRRAVPGQP